MKNPFGKTTDFDKPYAIYKGGNGFEWRILKTYKAPESEAKDQYARWFTSATSDMMQGGGYEMGDAYAKDIKEYGTLVFATNEWAEHYGAPHSYKSSELLDIRLGVAR